MTSPRKLRKATTTKLLVVLGTVIVLAEGLHFSALSSTRGHARAALAQALRGIPESDATTITVVLDAFDRMTADIFFAATGPYLILAILIPSLLISLVRLQNNLIATETVLRSILKNYDARTGVVTTPLASAKVNYPQNNHL